MPFEMFDRSRLKLKPLAEREHDLDLSVMIDPADVTQPVMNHPTVDILAERVIKSREKGAAVIMAMGAHVIRDGCAPLRAYLPFHDGGIRPARSGGQGYPRDAAQDRRPLLFQAVEDHNGAHGRGRRRKFLRARQTFAHSAGAVRETARKDRRELIMEGMDDVR